MGSGKAVVVLALIGLGTLLYFKNKSGDTKTWESPNANFKINNYDVVHFTCGNGVLPADTYWIALDIENNLAYATFNLDIMYNKVGDPNVNSKEKIIPFTPAQIANKETTINITDAIIGAAIVLGEKYDIKMYISDENLIAFDLVFKGVVDFGNVVEGGEHPLCLIPVP
mgnify:CR=1 FL=1